MLPTSEKRERFEHIGEAVITSTATTRIKKKGSDRRDRYRFPSYGPLKLMHCRLPPLCHPSSRGATAKKIHTPREDEISYPVLGDATEAPTSMARDLTQTVSK